MQPVPIELIQRDYDALRRPDEKLRRLIFEKENKENIDEDIQIEISGNLKRWPVYQEVIKNRQG